MGKLDGKISIVTGAGRGIGHGLALALSKEGASVAIVEMDSETCHGTADEIKSLGGEAFPILCDVRRREEVNSAVAATVGEFGTVNILVNNAQLLRDQVSLEDTTDELMAMTLESGLMGTMYFMQACLPYFKQNGGKIINFASAAGLDGTAGWAAYAATKEGIRALTRVAAHEWGQYGVNANVICPVAATPRMKEWADAFPDIYSQVLSSIPLGRMGDCENDIGRVVVFLASSDSDYITGHTLMVDGGQSVLR
jgi:NAD(P)-dependent dehydrogenase (short-subunit alcohol dehydrogenase family)